MKRKPPPKLATLPEATPATKGPTLYEVRRGGRLVCVVASRGGRRLELDSSDPGYPSKLADFLGYELTSVGSVLLSSHGAGYTRDDGTPLGK